MSISREEQQRLWDDRRRRLGLLERIGVAPDIQHVERHEDARCYFCKERLVEHHRSNPPHVPGDGEFRGLCRNMQAHGGGAAGYYDCSVDL